MKFFKKTSLQLLTVCLLSVLILTGCGTSGTGPVMQSISNVETLIHQAKQLEAEQYAPLELKLAQEKLQEAKKALEEDEIEKANQKAEEAMMDARLASQKAETAKAKKRAEKARENVEILKDEINRVQKNQ